ncbi:glycosyl hydrolase 115 family protein [Flammeovirga sp. SJP92]|uniref:glycosyl hydrolase 115 family protein n=1 Tax=Flammeovirga sp. SJP92 TaxID=1775430 RepID=UPI000789288F|nr:glycosyl hydrolase 115 family protein [Flammeovirga sp. SJP92]KXX68305.1 hypothetical protein AVL50_21210 [Flammeovirga sp. SJP92]
MKSLFYFFIYGLLIFEVNAQNIITEKYHPSAFPLIENGKIPTILFAQEDHEVVKTTVKHFTQDYQLVSGKIPRVTTSKYPKENVIIIGSLNNSKVISALVEKNLIDTVGLTNQWEKYSIQVISNPWYKKKKALVITGSDRRGTAYGVFEISKQMGVSPWYWWADVAVERKKSLYVDHKGFKSKSPDVKYRGIFINDEDWGLHPWSAKNFEKELGDIGPKTYAKVCELLLRLKANYLWPAMHECTGAFNKYADNKVVADQYGIVMGSSHCEPVLFNNATEWDKNSMGEWNYATNREGICKVLDQRVSENAPYENLYTIGIRGIHDHAMEGGFSVERKIELVEEAIQDQRSILAKHTGKSIEEVPQIFVPYAEVLHLYNNGLKVPDDITLMWVDDNYGYIRRLSDPLEQKRSGGSGVYYHIAYLGNPHEYTWLSTTNPALIYQEMKKAYDYKADRVWMVNVGDIKPTEYNTQFFLDLAWDVNSIKRETVFDHMYQWYQDIFGEELGKQCADLMYDYYQINFTRKPEFMGWGEEFSSSRWRERIEDTDISFTNYREAESRLSEFKALSHRANKLRSLMPKKDQEAFFELVYYPVRGAHFMNHKLLLAHKNRWYASLQYSGTNELIAEVKAYHDSTKWLTDEYGALLDGKWKGIISEIQSPGATFAKLPPTTKIDIAQKAGLGVMVEENEPSIGINTLLCLPTFTSHYKEAYYIDVFNKGRVPLIWSAEVSEDWIQLSKTSGTTALEQRILVTVDWTKLKFNSTGNIRITSGEEEEIIYVKAFDTKINQDSLQGVFVEQNGVISIPLEKYHQKVNKEEVSWVVNQGLGVTGASLTIDNNHAKTAGHWARNDKYAHVEYEFYTFNSGRFDISTYVLPTYPINGFQLHRFAVSVDDESPKTIYVGAEIDSDRWRNNVRRNSSIHTSSHYITKPGKHTLKIYYLDPGVVLDKAVMDFGGLKKSYLGPGETRLEDLKIK